jgi:Pentapeptide repeats (9 copies)/NACHT domain
MLNLAEAWETQLKKDLSGFADRGVEPLIEREGHTLRAAWVTRGREQSEMFGLNPEGALRWVSGPSSDDSYSDFLRSENLADFSQLAAAVKHAVPRQDNFIVGGAEIDTGFDDPSEVEANPPTIAEIADEGRLLAEGRTNLYFVKGEAGAGKTTLLKETTALQAERYLAGESEFLFFFISAQGRELSNLRDAFSGELQDLRAGFTRDAIAPLARAGLLIPIVDGFDELLGTAGYSGAFSSLQSLLGELEGLGAIVVSARSAFYDLEFMGRSSGPANDADISITTIDLEPWTDQQVQEFLGYDDDRRVADTFDRLSEADRLLLRRPFFASRFPSFAIQLEHDEPIDLLEHLITAYIEREAEKIVDSHGDPVLPVDGHRLLFELTASEMWEAEARALPLDDLRTLTEMVAEEFELGTDEAIQLSTKVTSYAGLQQSFGGSRDEFSFEHEVYFEYFLTRTIARFLRENRFQELSLFFDRGVVPKGVISSSLDLLDRPEGVQVEFLQCPSGVRYDNRRRNYGTLVAAYASRVGPIEGSSFKDLTFMDIVFDGTRFVDCQFDSCRFVGVDLAGARFDRCSAETSIFNAVALDNESRLGITGLVPGQNFGSIRHPATGDLFAPQDVLEVLTRLGLPEKQADEEEPTYSKKAKVLVKLLHHVARAYRRTNILYENDEHRRILFQDKFWPDLKKLLVENEIVTEEVRSVSGRPGTALRLRVPVEQLLIGQSAANVHPGPAANLWRTLRELDAPVLTRGSSG